MIPVLKPHFHTKEILGELRKVFDSGGIGVCKSTEFAEQFAAMCGAYKAVAVNSGMAALHLAIRAAGMKAGDEVLVPAFGFDLTVSVLLYERVVPVFVDCNPITLCMEVEDAASKFTEKTRAIIPFHFGGHAVDVDTFRDLAFVNKLTLIEDCAHACGATYKSRSLGTFGDMGVFSFETTMPLVGGGVVLTANNTLTAAIKNLREPSGYSAMHELAAVVSQAQMRSVRSDNRKRSLIAANYNTAFETNELIATPTEQPNVQSSWYLYPIKLKPPINRYRFVHFLQERGISASTNYEPLYMHPSFKGLCRADRLPVANNVWKWLVGLPIYPTLTPEEQAQVIDAVQAAIKDQIK